MTITIRQFMVKIGTHTSVLDSGLDKNSQMLQNVESKVEGL